MSKDRDLIIGRHPVVEAIEAGVVIDKILLQRNVERDFEREVRQQAKDRLIPVQILPREGLNRYTRANHQGIIALKAAVENYYLLEDMIPNLYELKAAPLILVLDGITDVRNMGAIARTAEVFGADALVISRKKAAQINHLAMKTSAGALNILPVCREAHTQAAIEFLKMSGFQIVASSLEGESLLGEIDFLGPTAIIIGAEDKGVSREVLALTDHQFKIPQLGKTDSLNVSVATGVILYQVMEQRLKISQ